MALALERPNWKDTDHWIDEMKKTLLKIDTKFTVLWIPSHVDIPGNEEADTLANSGAAMSQNDIPVSQKIVKARIKQRKWRVTHARAAEMYGNQRSPKMDIEKKWPAMSDRSSHISEPGTQKC